jgi:hypothetical protein
MMEIVGKERTKMLSSTGHLYYLSLLGLLVLLLRCYTRTLSPDLMVMTIEY